MLSDFFRINLPYGIAKNGTGEWMAFNREYMPLGFNDYDKKETPGTSYSELPIYTKYARISEKLLFEIAEDEKRIKRNEKGEIVMIFLYYDGNNPLSHNTSENWNKYFEKLKRLSKLKTA